MVFPNLCVRRLLLEWGERGGSRERRGRGEAFGEKKGMGKKRRGRQVGSEGWERESEGEVPRR